MRLIKPISQYALLAVAGLLFAACTSSQMEPAKQAVADAQSALTAASPAATKYAPDKLAALQTRLDSLKAALDAKDYATVLANAQGVQVDAKALAEDAAAKKVETVKALGAQWTELASSVPQLVASAQTRATELGKMRHVPKGIALATAKTQLADATQLWDKAKATQSSGNVEDAVTMAQSAKTKVIAAADAMKKPTAAKVAGLHQHHAHG